MLDTTEITTLERKWKRYKYKLMFKQSLIAITTVVLVGSSVYYYLNNYAPSYHAPLSKPKNTFIVQNDVPKKEPIKPISKQSSLQEAEVVAASSTQSEVKNKPLNVEETKPAQSPVSTVTLKLQPVQEVKNVSAVKAVPEVHVKKELLVETPKETNKPQKIDEKTPEATITQAVENKINIETKEVETTAYLKEKFYATHNIVFALMLSEEYYHLKDYKNALQWALSANEIDPQNERSWILFAKAKAKLGSPDEAIKALSVFQNTSPSSKVSILIKKIKSGDY